MYRVLITLFVLLPLTLFSQEGWIWQNPLPQGNTLNDVYFVDSNTGWQVGEAGTILFTDDYGESWTRQVSGTTDDILGVTFIDSNHGWAVGENGLILHTNNGGNDWSAQSSGTTDDLNCIFFIDSLLGWTVGESGAYFKTINGGQTWIDKHIRYKTDDFYSVCFISDQVGWTVGERGGIYRTDDSGENWSSQSSGTTDILADAYFIDENKGWIVGHPEYGTIGGILLYTENGGNIWTERDPDPSYDYRLHSVFFTNDSTGWICTSNGYLYQTIDYGENWLRKPIFSGGPILNSIHFSDTNNGWVVGSYGENFYTQNGGDTWEDVSSGFFHRLYAVHALSENNACAVGNGIFITSDGGDTWSEAQYEGSISHSLRDIYFPDNNYGWAVGLDNQIYHSTNGGINWTEQSSGVTLTTFYSVHFTDSNIGWAGGSNGTILKTVNGGQQWNPQISGTDRAILNIHFVNDTLGWIASEKEIIHTNDGGFNWNIQYTQDRVTLRDVFFINENIGWATGNNLGSVTGKILHTVDGGNTWNTRETEYTGISIYFSDPIHGWIVMDNGCLLITTDGGYNWYDQQSSCADLEDVHFINSETGWIVGGLPGNILRTDTGGDLNNHPELISSNEINIKEDDLLTYEAIANDIDSDILTYFFEDYPKWLTPAGNLISGMPGEGDKDTSFVVYVTDSKSSDRLVVQINIEPVNDPPQLISEHTSYSAFEDSLFQYKAMAIDPEDSTIIYTFKQYPSWLSVVDSVISGVPDSSSQDTSFMVLASDGALTDSLIININVIVKEFNPKIINLNDFTFINTDTVLIDLDTCVTDDNYEPEELNWAITSSNTNLNIKLENHIAGFSVGDWSGQANVKFVTVNPHGGSDSIEINVEVRTNTEINELFKNIPTTYYLEQNFPNPFNPVTVISWQLPVSSHVELSVFNILGQKLCTLVSEQQQTGYHQVEWNAREVSSGVYYYRLETEGYSNVKKMVVIK